VIHALLQLLLEEVDIVVRFRFSTFARIARHISLTSLIVQQWQQRVHFQALLPTLVQQISTAFADTGKR